MLIAILDHAADLNVGHREGLGEQLDSPRLDDGLLVNGAVEVDDAAIRMNGPCLNAVNTLRRLVEGNLAIGAFSSRSPCRYNKITGSPGARGSLLILSSSGEIGSQSSACAESVPLHRANTTTNPCIDVRLSAGMTDSLIPGFASVFTVHVGSRVAASMAGAGASSR